jgi:DNA polymerase-3 subunit delta'
MEPLIDSRQKVFINSYINNPSLPLGICGDSGAGKKYLAKHIANKLNNKISNCYILRPNEKNVITIEQARLLKNFFKLKHINTKDYKLAIVYDVQKMTTEAQNALLKLLEELPLNSNIIMTFTNKNLVLPTILSRLTVLEVKPLSYESTKSYFNIEVEEFNKAWHLSGGRIGLLNSLLGSKDHELINAVTIAKQLLVEKKFISLINIKNFTTKESDAIIEAINIIAKNKIKSSTIENNHALTKKWLKIYKLTYLSREYILKNANNKLILTNLVLEI